MALIDTHTHLESFLRQGVLPATLERARAAGLEAMITIGTGPDDWTDYAALAGEHPGFIHYTVGLHPCAVGREWERSLEPVEDFWRRPGPRPVALGEIGLDRFHLPKDPAAAAEIFGWQRAAFAAGLAAAGRLGCPVVVHSRGAFRECLEMIDACGLPWERVVFHCFTEGEAEMAELARRGGVGSFTGILTYKNAAPIRSAARAQGLGRFMLETDAPYLSPVPVRGQSNEPAFLSHTAAFAAAEVFQVSLAELAEISSANARRFFRL